MLKIEMKFLRGILFVRLRGLLDKGTSKSFENEVLPIILSNEIKYVVINLDSIKNIDDYGVESLTKVDDIISNNKGRTALCSLTSKQVKSFLHKDIYQNMFYIAANELTALGVINL